MSTASALISLVIGALASSATGCSGPDVAHASRDPAPRSQHDASKERISSRERQATEHVERLPRIDAESPSNEASQPPQSALEALTLDVAKRTGVTTDRVSITSSERVTWSDGSLGCPRAGEVYTQMLVSGYRVVVSAGNETFDYRLADSGFFRLCASPASSVTPLPGAADR